MTGDSPRLSLPYVAEAQAQKHVTVNEAFQRLDVLAQLTVEAFEAETPPLTALDGQTWALGATPTGDWSGQDGALAVWANGGWLFVNPVAGWIAVSETEIRVWSGAAWVAPDLPDLSNLSGIGVNTTYDGINRLSVASAATLLSHDGAGHQLKINKNAGTDTASLLFQTGWAGQAEMGTIGSNAFSIKVSDMTTWRTALSVDPGSGAVTLPNGLSVGGGTLALGDYGAGTRQDAQTGLNTQFLLGVDASGAVTEVSPFGAPLTEAAEATEGATIDLSKLQGFVRLVSTAPSAGYVLPAGSVGQQITLIGAQVSDTQTHTITAAPGVVVLHDPSQAPTTSAPSATLRNGEALTLAWRDTANAWIVTGRSARPDALTDSLAALSDLTGVADRIPYFTGAATMDLAPVTGFARSLLDDANAAAARATLGMGALGFNGGNVGIGTANPPYKLVISNSGASGIEYGPGYSGTSNLIQHYNRSGGAYCDAVNDAAQHRFNIAGAEKARIDTGGNLLVGKTAPTNAGNGFFALPAGVGGFTTTDAYALILRRDGSDGVIQYFSNDGTLVGNISVSGSSTSYNTSSDYRLKEDVRPVEGAAQRVLALAPVNFAWRAGGDRVDGFIAHEVQAVVPAAVMGAKDAMQTEDYEVAPAEFDADGNQIAPAVIGTREVPVYQSIDHSKLIPVLTAALQEALRRIEVLEASHI
ncbi:MAG: DUF2793 domain-containing protein [Paracoccaceae bacterium]